MRIFENNICMSQAGAFIQGGGGGMPIETITGNSGGAVGPDGMNNINVVGDSTTITVAGNPGTNTLTISALNTFTPTNSNTNIAWTGSTQDFAGDGSNIVIGCPAATISGGTQNMIYGNVGGTTITGSDNIAIGFYTIQANAGGTFAGNKCVAIGTESLFNINGGSYDVAIGFASGANLIGNESSTICINALGTIGKSNALFIGSGTGSGNQQLSEAHICGINGVDLGVTNIVTISSDQLGSATLTAGTGISIGAGPSANEILISATGTTNLNYTNVNSTPYVVGATDDYLSVDCSGGAITVELPNAATSGRVYTIKDRTGSAATHNITVRSVSGLVNIDGATTFVINTNYESINVMGNGTSFEIY